MRPRDGATRPRRFVADDGEALTAILLHPDVARWLGRPGATRDDAMRAIERCIGGPGGGDANTASIRVAEKLGLERCGTTAWAGRDHIWFETRSSSS